MNLILWSKGSSAAVPFSYLVAILALWFGISVPLTYIGAYFGFKKRVKMHIVKILIGWIAKIKVYSIFLVYWTSCAHKSNSKTNTWTEFLYSGYSWRNYGRSSTFWLHIHSTILHTQFFVVTMFHNLIQYLYKKIQLPMRLSGSEGKRCLTKIRKKSGHGVIFYRSKPANPIPLGWFYTARNQACGIGFVMLESILSAWTSCLCSHGVDWTLSCINYLSL